MIGVWLIVLASSSTPYGKVPRLILKKTSRLTQAVVVSEGIFCAARCCVIFRLKSMKVYAIYTCPTGMFSGTFYAQHSVKGGSYGNKILYKNLDLTQDFPNKISFHFLWVKMLPKNLPKIFRWPEMCPLDKILAQHFQMAGFTKILGRRDISVVPLLSTENCKTLFHTACMAVTAMQR